MLLCFVYFIFVVVVVGFVFIQNNDDTYTVCIYVLQDYASTFISCAYILQVSGDMNTTIILFYRNLQVLIAMYFYFTGT